MVGGEDVVRVVVVGGVVVVVVVRVTVGVVVVTDVDVVPEGKYFGQIRARGKRVTGGGKK